MKINVPKLFLEINSQEYIFVVGSKDQNDVFKILYKNSVSIQGINNNKIIDFELVFSIINKNVYLIEQKLNHTFKDIILILDNFHYSFVNLTGYKKLNGSQILKENITYILNLLKSTIDEFEKKKTIIHIFNSQYYLDKKKIENLPIGLFGDFYSHELSFCLINNNDHNNLHNIFKKCNLKIKKIIFKSFVEGVYLSEKNNDLNTFFKVNINEKNSQIIYFENDSLKFVQNFKFGTDLILNDISKITAIDKDVVKKILINFKTNQETSGQEFIENKFFDSKNFRKIKKKLLYDIASARIEELADVLISKNINLTSFNKQNMTYFLKINDQVNLECFKDSYKLFFSKNNSFIIKFIDNINIKEVMDNANRLADFGWKKEAIPIIRPKKSLIAKFFDALFN